ncbi:MAG: META domain-containing protein [Sulfuricellaceae bacterium]|nr:META domain-containing protein [Sulfuricellaceae bacterium]
MRYSLPFRLSLLFVLIFFSALSLAQDFAKSLPATFEGKLPCADCPGTLWTLKLSPDQSYRLNVEYLERQGNDEKKIEKTGRWKLDADQRKLTISQKGQPDERFEILDANTLRKLDMNGRPILSELNYVLKRYGSTSTAKLTDTYWKLVQLDGEPIAADQEKKDEQHIVLAQENQRLTGFAGCNRIIGGYQLEDQRIAFSMAVSRRACFKGEEAEAKFLATLSQAARWKVDGQNMELFDQAGKTIARFQAAYLR